MIDMRIIVSLPVLFLRAFHIISFADAAEWSPAPMASLRFPTWWLQGTIGAAAARTNFSPSSSISRVILIGPQVGTIRALTFG
jgi:hypothetical protein